MREEYTRGVVGYELLIVDLLEPTTNNERTNYFLMNFFFVLSKPWSTFFASKCQTGLPER